MLSKGFIVVDGEALLKDPQYWNEATPFEFLILALSRNQKPEGDEFGKR